MRSRTPDENGMLLCTECSSEKPKEEFYLTGRQSKRGPTYFSYCRACTRARAKAKRRGEPVADHRPTALKAELTCRRCGFVGPQEDFSLRGGRQKGQRDSLCKPCKNARHLEWLRENPEKAREYRTSPEYRLRKKASTYGLSPDEVVRQREAQRGLCAGCLRPFGPDRPEAFDHDHSCCSGRKSCGKCFRGILCKQCNSAVGLAQDDPSVLERLATYVRGFNETGTRASL